ncbi:MAG: TonB C-terminal domain-containing protein [Acidobacteriota bacterium]
MTRAADLQTVTEILVHRDRLDVGFPLSIAASFIGHIALMIFLSVFQGFHWARSGKTLSIGGGEKVTMVSLPTIGKPPAAPAVPLPPPPAPATLDIDEPAIDFPDPDAEIEFKLPEAPKPKAEKAKATPTIAPPAPRLPPPPAAAAKPTKGSLGLIAGAGTSGVGSGAGPAGDPGLAFYAQRITSLIDERWRRPYVNVGAGTVLETTVYFGIRRDGSTFDISVETPSGIPNMDQSALRAVMDAGRLIPLPPSFPGDDLTVSFKFQYTAGE